MTAIRFFSAPDAQREVTPSGAHQAFLLLRTVFTIAPIAFGLDKFFDLLTDWEQYLAPWINDLVPGRRIRPCWPSAWSRSWPASWWRYVPAIGAYVVAAWLLGIIVNLVSIGDYYDIALRDFGLLVGALALARLAAPAPRAPGPPRLSPTSPRTATRR